MDNVFFMREPLAYAEKKVSLIALNQKQLKPSLELAINAFMAQEQNSLILVSLSQEGADVLKKMPPKWMKRIMVIDAFSRDAESGPNLTVISNVSDLTSIQIAMEKAESILPGKKVIIFDALNVLSIYLKKEILGKFVHLLSNKIKLENKAAVFFLIKESTDPEALEILQEFADKNYDFSGLFLAGMSLNE